jgi:peptide-methionine (S)-S-oxide reductase
MKIIAGLILLSLFITTLPACAQQKKRAVVHLSSKELSKYSQATFAAGCFWHEEAIFESIKGVKEAISGYAGGSTKNPTYKSIEEGNTGHTETVNVYYDSTAVSYATLLKVYFAGQDPTQVNGQGPDRGPQYRSVLFYRNNNEKQLAQNYMKSIAGKYSKPIAVQLMPFTRFWEAEAYHQNYIDHNPGSRYVQGVSIPEIKHVQKLYPELVKPDHVF